jgi:hypothetical protein
MAKGIQLAGGYGAGGINDALADLIAQKQIAQDREEMRAARAQQLQRQAMLDAQAAEDRTFTRQRMTKQDERTARMDDEAREGKLTREGLDLATLFPGKVVSGDTLKRYPKFLHELIAAPKDEQLASRSIGGVSVAGDPNAGEIDITENEAVAPGSFELQLPESERKRIADTRAAAAAEKGERDETYRRDKLDADTKHRETMATIAANRGSGGGAMRKITYTDENGDTVEEYVTPDEARRRGPMKKPKTQKPVTGAERQTLSYYNRAKQASDDLAATDKGGKSLEDRIAAQRTDKSLWGKFAPNLGQTEEQQLYRQAQRAFTEARLRKESGAAIPPAEYESDAKIYFAEPGDTAASVAQKRRARQAVLDGLKFSSQTRLAAAVAIRRARGTCTSRS